MGLDDLDGIVTGKIQKVHTIVGSASGLSTVSGTLDIFAGEIPSYDGSYDVTPLPFTEILLETASKRMERDVTVREIPYYETTNDSGGYTVNIG